MTGRDDMTLLREFAATESEAAFAELVERHVNLVYSTALRSVGREHAAQEITQAVFIILARKAKSLSANTILSGWLHQTTRLTAANLLRTEIRRQKREQEAYMQSTLNEPDPDVWPQIAPLLDNVLDKLGKRDRNAIVLRFFENKNLREVGLALGTSEDAAKMRVNRALEKLRKLFMKGGAAFSAAAIAGAVSANSVHAAPAGLSKIISAVAVAKGATAGGSTMALVKGALKIMAWGKIKTAMCIGVAGILATGTTTLLAQHQVLTNASSPSNLKANAAIPYRMVDDACQFADGFDQTKLVVHMTITSSKAVRPADIHLTIQSAAKGPIAVQLGSKGQILNFPHDKTLRRENPRIVANQPKGTLRLGIWFYVPLPPELTFRYSRLGDTVAAANDGIARAKKLDFAKAILPFGDKTKVQSVVFVFPKSSAKKAKILIAAAKGSKEFTADADGLIQIKIEDSLLAENPEVILSEKPQYAVPVPD